MLAAKESVVIVEAKGCGRFSKQLYNLIGTNDDLGEDIIGPADGEVEASIFDEKQFGATKLSSYQKIVFVGKPKTGKDYIAVIEAEADNIISKYGIHICWSGKHASVYVDGKGLDEKGYLKFLSYARKHGQELPNLLVESKDKMESVAVDEAKKDPPIVEFAKKIVEPPIMQAVQGVAGGTAVAMKSRQIYEQRFHFAIKLFYLEELRDFVEA